MSGGPRAESSKVLQNAFRYVVAVLLGRGRGTDVGVVASAPTCEDPLGSKNHE